MTAAALARDHSQERAPHLPVEARRDDWERVWTAGAGPWACTAEVSQLLGISPARVRRLAHSGALLAGRFGNIALYYGPEALEFGQTLPRVVPESAPEPFVGLRYRDHRGERHLLLAKFRAETAEAVWGQRVTVTGEPRGWERVPLEWIEERYPVRWDAKHGVLCRADRWPES